MEEHFRTNQGAETQQFLTLLLFLGQWTIHVAAQGHCPIPNLAILILVKFIIPEG